MRSGECRGFMDVLNKVLITKYEVPEGRYLNWRRLCDAARACLGRTTHPLTPSQREGECPLCYKRNCKIVGSFV